MLEIRFHGRGGQGALTAARILASAFWKEKKYVLVLPEFKSERRSAPILVGLRVDENPIILRSAIYAPDYLIILDASLIRFKQARVLEGFKRESGLIILNAVQDLKYPIGLAGCRAGIADVDFITQKYGLGQKALPAVGTAMLGVFAKITNLLNLESIIEATEESDELPKKGNNIKAVKESFERAKMIEFPASDKLTETEIPPAGIIFQDFKELPGSVISLSGTAKNLTGAWRKIRPYYQNKTSPCQNACPLGNDIPYWLSLLKQGKNRQAWEKLMEKNPFPAVTGRVCRAFCEKSCNRNEFDESVSIRNLEKFLGDEASARGWHPPVLEKKFKPFNIAVVGSGPAGLSCAYQLARKNFRVIVFEQFPVLGGQLRFGIPEFRLPKDVLEKEINNIIYLGVKVCKGIFVDQKFFETIKRYYDAVFFAAGLQKSRKLNIEGEENPDVLYGLDFLKNINFGNKAISSTFLGEKVVIIGGGNTAIDAARTAKRFGSEVSIFYRRTKIEMPAIKEDVILAEKEGIEIRELLSPVRIFSKSGQNFLECQRNQPGKSAESSRNNPLPIEGSNFLEQFDNLIVAVGEEAENSFFVESEDWKVFLGGDIKTKAGTVPAAIGSGREAAEKIEKILLGEPPLETKDPQIVKFSDLNPVYFNKNQKREPASRSEAKRCFSCGVCDFCGNCWKFCPHMAVSEKQGELKINYDYCKGCGICAQECPRSAISQKLEE
ncbi:MAG: FAD-dependent oxidoreductase [Patescibacteria group bacterium]